MARNSESLDDDKLEDAQYPPDRPLGAEDRGIDDTEDSVAERSSRENPDRWPSRWEGAIGTLVEDEGDAGADLEADAVALEARDEHDQLRRELSAQDLEEIQPAEEAAMHLTDPPPMGDGDGYVED